MEVSFDNYLCQGGNVFTVIWFICFLAGLIKKLGLILTKLGGRVEHGPWKKKQDFGADPNPWADTGIREFLKVD